MDKNTEKMPTNSFRQQTIGLTVLNASYILNNSQKSLWVYTSYQISLSCVSNFLFYFLFQKKPQALQTLFISRFNLSSQRSNLTVYTFKKSATFLASAVFLKVGLLINSRMNVIGKTVSPHAPQQARIGQPNIQKKATIKQTMVELNCRQLGVSMNCSELTLVPQFIADTSMRSTGIETMPQKDHPTPMNNPTTPNEMIISKNIQTALFHQGSSQSLQQREVAIGFNTARLPIKERQSTSQKIVRSSPELLLLATSMMRKKGWNCV